MAAAGLTLPGIVAGVEQSSAAAPGRQVGLKGGDGTMIVAISGEPVSFNPNLHADPHVYVPACSIFSRLVTLDAEFNVLPELAERWTIDDDGLTYTFQLDRTAKWHDAESVTAADVKYTLDLIRESEVALAHRWLAPIAEVEIPNDSNWSVVLRLSHPSASLLRTLGYERTFILPAHRYRGTDWMTNPANQHPIGSGPFRFLSYTPGATIDLAAFYVYFGSGPELDHLLFQIMPDPAAAAEALRNGEIDLIVAPMPLAQLTVLRQTPGIEIGDRTLPAILFLGFNLEHEPVSNPALRRALARAIDRQPIVEQALAGLGVPATSFLPTVFTWAVAEEDEASAPPFDPATAAADLDEAGFPVSDGVRFRLIFPYLAAEPEHERVASVIREQLLAINVETELVSLEADAWRERVQDGDFQMTLITGSLAPDPTRLRDYVGTDGENNHWHFSDAAIDVLFEEGETLADEDERAAVYGEVQRLLAAELPVLPLLTPRAIYPHTDRASGFFFGDAQDDVGLNQFSEVELEPLEPDE